MSSVTKKLATAVRVFRHQGLEGVGEALRQNLHHAKRSPRLQKLVRFFAPALPLRVINEVPFTRMLCVEMLPGKRLYLDAESDWMAADLVYHGFKGFGGETLELFLKILKNAGTVLDIGSNTGIFALVAAIENPKRQVYAFEPVPRIYNHLQRNIDLNRLRNLHPCQAAVSDYNGEITLYIPAGDLPTEASTQPGFREAAETIIVEAITLDSFVAQHKIARIDLIKVDTETTEPIVLKGGKETLEKHKPAIVCEVLKGTTETRLHELLDDLGYQYYWITDQGLVRKDRIVGDGTYKFLNYLFITEERAKEYLGAGVPAAVAGAVNQPRMDNLTKLPTH
jgi:FkbM family methyltransferase